jgi:hypothetical protein
MKMAVTKEWFLCHNRSKMKVAVTKERLLCPQTLENEGGGHKREVFVPGNARK